MKCVIVVLALSGLCAAAPEADPQLLVPSSTAFLPSFNPLVRSVPFAHTFTTAPVVRTTVPVAAPIVRTTVPVAAPIVRTTVPVAAPVVRTTVPVAAVSSVPVIPQAPASVVRSIAPINPNRRPGVDCVTLEGCAVRDLIDAGFTGRRVRREADADPQLLYPYSFPTVAAPYTAPAIHPYAGLYNPYYYNPLGYRYAAGAPLLSYASAPLATTTTVAAATPIVESAPVVATETVSVEPAPETIPAAVVAAEPVVKAVPVTQHIVNPVVPLAQPVLKAAAVVQPAPLLYKTPIVARQTKKVTYTHIGKHPVHPTSVYETKERLIF